MHVRYFKNSYSDSQTSQPVLSGHTHVHGHVRLGYLLNSLNKLHFQNQDHIDDNLDHRDLVLKDFLICTKDFGYINHRLPCIYNLDQNKIF